MRGKELLEKIELVDFTYIEAADVAPKTKKLNWMKKWGTVAACFVLLVSIGIGTYAYAAEIKEYNAAVRFFDDNDLSTEGLTREEIKEVYRDITEKTFSHPKTAQIITNGNKSNTVSGYEIEQETPTTSDNIFAWDGTVPTIPAQTGVYYDKHNEYSKRGFRHKISYFEKYDGDTLVWSVAISEFPISYYKVVSDGIIIYGETHTWDSRQVRYAWIAKIDDNGNILWKQKMDNGFHSEWVDKILENSDGSYAVFSRGDFEYLCLSQYTADGKRTLFKKTETGDYTISNAIHFQDGYIVQLSSYSTNECAKIAKVDYEGNVTEFFSYSSEDECYYITDMIEFNSKIYLSAYAVPKLEEGQSAGGRYDIAGVLDGLFEYDTEKGVYVGSLQGLAEKMRQNFTAVLLVCDSDSGTPEKFFSVKGSLGGKLSLSDSGNLLWNAGSIESTLFSPATSSFTIAATCRVFRYTFDECGVLVSQEKTDEFTSFRR